MKNILLIQINNIDDILAIAISRKDYKIIKPYFKEMYITLLKTYELKEISDEELEQYIVKFNNRLLEIHVEIKKKYDYTILSEKEIAYIIDGCVTVFY